MKKLICATLVLAAAATGASAATVDFEGGLSLGQSVNGQAGWTVEDQWGNTGWGDDPAQFDQEVVDDGTGNTVWRVSNAVTNGGLSAQPFSQVTQAAGEPGSALWNDRGPDHTNPLAPPNPNEYASATRFVGQFNLRSATGGAQPGLGITVSPSAKQFDGRMSYLSLVDNGASGLDLFFYETGPASDPWASSSVLVASDLSYTDWHSVKFEMDFVAGLQDTGGELYGNDVVKIYVNGQLVHEGTSWESYYYGTPTFGLTSDDKRAVNSLTFSLRGTAAPGTLGGGYYVDDVTVAAVAVPLPAAAWAGMGLMGALGGVAGIKRRLRRE